MTRAVLWSSAALLALTSPLAAHDGGDTLRIHDTRAERSVEFGEMADALAGYDVVFVGEMHDDPATHRFELALLEAVAARRGEGMLSLEMFERDAQVPLDEYGVGRMAEDAFLAAARPWPNYGTDYRPLVEAARARRWPVVAANVPRPLAASVARGGFAALDTLPPSHGRLYAARRGCAPEGEYFRRFAQTMQGHGGHGGDTTGAGAVIARYYQSQCLKDETMAESIVRARAAWPGRIVVHYNGAFHSDRRLGTVERLARRDPSARIAVVSVVPVARVEDADAAEHAAHGDYVVFVPRPDAPSP